MSTVIGTPLAPFADALFSVLAADAGLAALARTAGQTVTVVATLPRNTRVDFPYVIVGDRRELHGTGFAMQTEGGAGGVYVDAWSAWNGPAEVQDIQARIRVLLLRDPAGAIALALRQAGYTLFGGSLVCDEELAFRDADPNMPERTLYHGVQRWTADLEGL